MPGPTLILDRSSLHGENFDLLKASSLLSKVRRKCIIIHHTPIFIEETLAFCENPQHWDTAKIQLPFITEMCNGCWFQLRDPLWHQELVEDRGPKVNPFLAPSERARIEAEMRRITVNPQNPELRDALDARHAERLKRDAQGSIFREIREEIAQKKRDRPQLKQQGKPSLQGFLSTETAFFGTKIIDGLIPSKYKRVVRDRWTRNKARYPYFTNFVQGLLYAGYHAMLETNERIDPNAQADIEQLSYLHDADIIVSNDVSFQQSAFRELWKPKGKVFFTTEQFLDYIR